MPPPTYALWCQGWVSCQDIHQQIIVSPDYKWHISKALFEMFSDAPCEGEELQLGAVIILLHWCQGVAAKCDRMVAPVILFLRQHSPQPFLGGIHLQKEWFVRLNGLSD